MMVIVNSMRMRRTIAMGTPVWMMASVSWALTVSTAMTSKGTVRGIARRQSSHLEYDSKEDSKISNEFEQEESKENCHKQPWPEFPSSYFNCYFGKAENKKEQLTLLPCTVVYHLSAKQIP